MDVTPKVTDGEGTIWIPAQNLKGFPLSDITVAGTAVGFTMKGVPGGPAFAGTLVGRRQGHRRRLHRGWRDHWLLLVVERRGEVRGATQEHRDHEGPRRHLERLCKCRAPSCG